MNTVFVLFDSLNRLAIGPYGGAVATPNFDRFAQRAVTFDAALCCAMGRRSPLLPRRYNKKLRNVVRIMMFTTVFFADMTPKTPSNGWCAPPIFLASSRLATRLCGVNQTRKQMVKMPNKYGM